MENLTKLFAIMWKKKRIRISWSHYDYDDDDDDGCFVLFKEEKNPHNRAWVRREISTTRYILFFKWNAQARERKKCVISYYIQRKAHLHERERETINRNKVNNNNYKVGWAHVIEYLLMFKLHYRFNDPTIRRTWKTFGENYRTSLKIS